MPYFFFFFFLPNVVSGVVVLQLVFRRLSAVHTHICGVQLEEGGARIGVGGGGGLFIGSFICKFPLTLPSLILSLSLIFFVVVKCPECVEVSPFPRLWRSQLATCEAHKTNHLKDLRMALPTGEVMTRLRARQWRKLTIVTINMIINNTQQKDWCEVTVAKELAEDLMMLLNNG